MKEFKDINKIIKAYKEAIHRDDVKLNSLCLIDFMALIYALDTGQYELTGFSNKGFLRYSMTSGVYDSTNWALDIINNLPYSKDDFIKLL